MDPLFFFHQGIDATDSPERFTPRYYASVGSVNIFSFSYMRCLPFCTPALCIQMNKAAKNALFEEKSQNTQNFYPLLTM